MKIENNHIVVPHFGHQIELVNRLMRILIPDSYQLF
jgi:hypothetical protein